jgi:hypothetical protein
MFVSTRKSRGLDIQAAQEPTRLYSITEDGILNCQVSLEIINWLMNWPSVKEPASCLTPIISYCIISVSNYKH